MDIDPSGHIVCEDFPCTEMVHHRFRPAVVDLVDVASVRCVMVSEAPALDPNDDFAGAGTPFFMQTTIQAFADAGFVVGSIADILELGVYVTTAVKCAKPDSSVPTEAVKNCSHLLEAELDLFPDLSVILCMGDVAIRSINEIARRRTGRRVIPAGSTYRIRGPEYVLDGVRVIPSYLQTGRSYLIEKSKRQMIAEDIRTALELIGHRPAA
jgi:hypothetical protein